MSKPVTDASYAAAIEALARDIKRWMALHPGATPKIEFNYTPKVMVSMAIREAMRMGFISVDAAGLELIEAVCLTGSPEPTPTMLKIALELYDRPVKREMPTTKTPGCVCPACGSKLDCATSLERGQTPGPGDFSLCIMCGEILIYNESMLVRRVEQKDLDELEEEQISQLRKAQELVREERTKRDRFK